MKKVVFGGFCLEKLFWSKFSIGNSQKRGFVEYVCSLLQYMLRPLDRSRCDLSHSGRVRRCNLTDAEHEEAGGGKRCERVPGSLVVAHKRDSPDEKCLAGMELIDTKDSFVPSSASSEKGCSKILHHNFTWALPIDEQCTCQK